MSDDSGFWDEQKNDNQEMDQPDAQDGGSFEDEVDDPAALRRAEEAVSHWDSPSDGQQKPPIDEAWSVVATQNAAGDYAGLDDVARALDQDGVDFGWDPYDPRQTVNFLPPDAGLTARKLFSIMVPASQFEAARVSLYGTPPGGVAYAWTTDLSTLSDDSGPGGSMGPVSGPSGPMGPDVAGDGFGPGSSAGGTGISRDDPRLSDNARLERMARGGPRYGALFLAFAAILLAIGVVAFLLMRG